MAALKPAWVRNLGSVAVVLLFLLGWELLDRTKLVSNVLLPPPSSLIWAFAKEQRTGVWAQNVLSSLRHYSLGVFAGSVLGIALGIASGMSRVLEVLQEGIARVLRPIPPIAWIPFAITWFGISETAAAFIIGIGAFWFNYFASQAAVRSLDKGLIELSYAFGQGGFTDRLTKIIVPGAAPGIFAGIRAGLGMGWVNVLAAELFGVVGIGQRMTEAAGLLAMDVVILYMATIALLYSASDFLIVLLMRNVLTWQE